jgi:hypothetical protein
MQVTRGLYASFDTAGTLDTASLDGELNDAGTMEDSFRGSN